MIASWSIHPAQEAFYLIFKNSLVSYRSILLFSDRIYCIFIQELLSAFNISVMTTLLIFTGISFVLMIITGVILSRIGHPYHKTVFAFHKIFSLLSMVLLIWVAIPYLKPEPRGSLFMIASYITGGMLLVSFVSGVLLSFEKVISKYVTYIHRLSTAMMIICTLVTTWMILGK